MDVKSSTISVIGCGWLGLSLAIELVGQGYKVRGSTTSVDKLEKLRVANILPYQLELSSQLTVDDDDLFNCSVAVINIPPGRKDKDVVMSYPNKIDMLIDRLKSHLVNHVIFVSTTGVYQNIQGEVDESLSCKPEKSSGQAVLHAEQSIIKSGIDYKILRMAGLVGGRRQPGNWFAGKTDIKGGDTPVNMVHRDDCIQAIIQVIEKPRMSSDIYNICADEHPTKQVFYKKQATKISVPLPSFCDGVVPYKVVINKKFKKHYNFKYAFPDPSFF